MPCDRRKRGRDINGVRTCRDTGCGARPWPAKMIGTKVSWRQGEPCVTVTERPSKSAMNQPGLNTT